MIVAPANVVSWLKSRPSALTTISSVSRTLVDHQTELPLPGLQRHDVDRLPIGERGHQHAGVVTQLHAQLDQGKESPVQTAHGDAFAHFYRRRRMVPVDPGHLEQVHLWDGVTLATGGHDRARA